MSGSKISIILAATALLVAVLGATPVGQAAGRLVLPKNSVGAVQLKKSAVTGLKVKNGSLLAADFKAGQLPSGPQGPKGDAGAQGAQGVQGIQGVSGTARAYGRIAGDGTLTRSKNVTGITHPYPGVYCIALEAGIDPSQTGLVATPDFLHDDTTNDSSSDSQTLVEWLSDAGLVCPAGRLAVATFYRYQVTSGGYVSAIKNRYHDESFFFVVP